MLPNYRLLAKYQRLLSDHSFSIQQRVKSQFFCSTIPIASKRDAYLSERVGVDINITKLSNGGRHAHFRGLMTCDSGWTCPVCAPRKAAWAGARLTETIKGYNRIGYKAFMMTLTIPHYRTQSAVQVLENLRKVRKEFSNYMIYTYKKKVPFAGTFTSCEVKHSKIAGWHFHLHQLYFIPENCVSQFFADEEHLRKMWQKYIDKYNLVNDSWTNRNNPLTAGLMISKHEFKDGKYLAKELCKVDQEKDVVKSRYAFELLESNSEKDHELFIELAAATVGKKRFSASHGLYRRINLDEEAIKKKLADDAGITSISTVCSFTIESWNEIMNDEEESGGEKNHRRGLLTAAELDGLSGVVDYCVVNALPFPIWNYVLEKRLQLAAPATTPVVEADEIITPEKAAAKERWNQTCDEMITWLFS